MNLWYGEGEDDAVSLGPALRVWTAMEEVFDHVQGDLHGDPDEFEELLSVPGFGEQAVTVWWMRQVLEQARRYKGTYEKETSAETLWVVERIISEFEAADCGEKAEKKFPPDEFASKEPAAEPGTRDAAKKPAAKKPAAKKPAPKKPAAKKPAAKKPAPKKPAAKKKPDESA